MGTPAKSTAGAKHEHETLAHKLDEHFHHQPPPAQQVDINPSPDKPSQEKSEKEAELEKESSFPAVVKGAAYGGACGAAGRALLDAHRIKVEVAHLQRRAAELNSAKQADLPKGIFIDESADVLQ